jgi:D-alanyl-D-alanine carboxypeptidase (penicillin-binding protein 5/6)
MGGTTACLQPGMTIRLADLFYGMMLPSGNDAAVALAEAVGHLLLQEREDVRRSKLRALEEDCADRRACLALFLTRMNEHAKSLGLINTIFTNPTGLSQKTNYSSAEDVARLVT